MPEGLCPGGLLAPSLPGFSSMSPHQRSWTWQGQQPPPSHRPSPRALVEKMFLDPFVYCPSLPKQSSSPARAAVRPLDPGTAPTHNRPSGATCRRNEQAPPNQLRSNRRLVSAPRHPALCRRPTAAGRALCQAAVTPTLGPASRASSRKEATAGKQGHAGRGALMSRCERRRGAGKHRLESERKPPAPLKLGAQWLWPGPPTPSMQGAQRRSEGLKLCCSSRAPLSSSLERNEKSSSHAPWPGPGYSDSALCPDRRGEGPAPLGGEGPSVLLQGPPHVGWEPGCPGGQAVSADGGQAYHEVPGCSWLCSGPRGPGSLAAGKENA